MYILLTIRFGIEISSKPHHPPRRVYCPPRPHQCKKSLHPGTWVLHMVVALKSMSLLIGLKHIDTFSIIKNKRSKKKGKRRNKSILVNDSLNRSNSLNPDFKFIHEQTSFLGYSQSYRWCMLEFWSFTRVIRYSGSSKVIPWSLKTDAYFIFDFIVIYFQWTTKNPLWTIRGPCKMVHKLWPSSYGP